MSNIQSLKKYITQNSGLVPHVIIIGTGPAGYFAASQLLEHGLQVVILDAGNAQPDLDFQRFFELSSQGYPPEKSNLGLSWQLGGASNLWSGRVAPLDENDLSEQKGWLYGFDTLEPYYDKVAKTIGVTSMRTIRDEPASLNPKTNWAEMILDQDVTIKRFQWSTPPFNTRLALNELSSKYSNISIVTGTRVLAFESLNADGAVSYIQVAEADGTQHKLKAQKFILAAGGIESPRILLNSQNGKGIGNSSNLVGAYFSTHPKMNIGTLKLKRQVSLTSPLFSDTTRGDKNLRFGIGFSKTSSTSEALNHYIQFSHKFEKIGTYAIEETQRFINGSAGRSLGRGFIGSAAVVAGRVAFNTLGKSGIWRKRASTLTLRGFFDQHPSREHRIDLSQEKDIFGMRKAQIHWDLSEEDTTSIRHFIDKLSELFKKYDLGVLQLEIPENPKEWPLTSIHSHFLGTLRMGSDPTKSVTNSDGRLHDVPNVYICGSATFPSYGNANPFLTIAALALRTADKIASK